MRPAPGTLRRFIGLALPALVLLLIAVNPLFATRVRSVNLEQMTERADRVFSGRAERVRVIDDEQLGQRVTLVTFAVDRSVKGALGSQVTIKLLGDRSGNGSQDWIGLPSFREGEEVVLFLYGDSRLGLTSPVGFAQGKFNVYLDKQGQRKAINALGNRGLHSDLSVDARERLGLTQRSLESRREVGPGELLDQAERLMK